MGKVVIQSGYLARRVIQFPDEVGIRPSSSRVRKVLFDWLRFKIKNKKCLDLFSGSGILAFEAVSNGCQSVTCVDHQKQACNSIQKHISSFNVNDIHILQQEIPFKIKGQYDIIMMDPPFHQRDQTHSLMLWIYENNLLNLDGLLYLESDQHFDRIEGWDLIKSKKVSTVWMHLFKVLA